MPNPADDRLKFSREVRIGELIAALVFISTTAGVYIELRLRPIEIQLAAQDEFKKELKDDLRRLNEKLDRLIEILPKTR